MPPKAAIRCHSYLAHPSFADPFLPTASFSPHLVHSIQNGLAGWNYMNGGTYFQGSTDTHYLGDTSASPYGSSANPDKFRTLIRFEGLHRCVAEVFTMCW